MLLNLNKFKFLLTTTFLFFSPDTLALHLSVLIDDKESPISESLIIKDVISIGVVPFNVMRTELPPEFNGTVNGIPEDPEELPEFNGAVNGIPNVTEELPEFIEGVGMVPPIHKVPVEVYPEPEIPVQVDHDKDSSVPGIIVPDISVPDIPVPKDPGKVAIVNVDWPVYDDKEPLNRKGTPEILYVNEFKGSVNGDTENLEELPEFNGAVNGIPNVTEELPVVTYVSITAVPANAPIMDKPEYVEPHQPLSQRKLEENNSILLKHQFNKLRSLQTYCIANKNEFCYGIRHHYMAKNDIHDNLLGLRLGYGITNKLTLGVNIERSLENHLSNNYRTLHNNVGIGAFAHYKLPSNLYIAASIGKDSNSYQKTSSVLTTALSDVKGVSWNLTLGQDLVLSNKNSLGWYLSYRDTQIKQNGYDVPVSQFLMKHNNIKWREHSLASGIKWNYSITTKLTLLNTIEIEHQIKSNIHTDLLQIGNLKYDYYPNVHKTRWSISSGLNYQFSPKFSISFTPYIKNGLINSKQWGTYLSLEGKF